jgi:phosphoenolpyruvate carboxykinase (ATP)
MLHVALGGELAEAEFRTDALFGFEVPLDVPGVEARLLDPRATWRDPEQYDRKARELAAMFTENFDKRFGDIDVRIRDAGPRSV